MLNVTKEKPKTSDNSFSKPQDQAPKKRLKDFDRLGLGRQWLVLTSRCTHLKSWVHESQAVLKLSVQHDNLAVHKQNLWPTIVSTFWPLKAQRWILPTKPHIKILFLSSHLATDCCLIIHGNHGMYAVLEIKGVFKGPMMRTLKGRKATNNLDKEKLCRI